jgi:hypothetical protein
MEKRSDVERTLGQDAEEEEEQTVDEKSSERLVFGE